MNMLKSAPLLFKCKRTREAIAFAVAPEKHVSATNIESLLLLDSEFVIRRLVEAGGLAIARELQSTLK